LVLDFEQPCFVLVLDLEVFFKPFNKLGGTAVMKTVSTPLILGLVGVNLLALVVFLISTRTPRSRTHVLSGTIFVLLSLTLAVIYLIR